MRFPTILESADYGNPEAVMERRQAQQANAAKRAADNPPRRATITLKRPAGLSETRKAWEQLFDPAAPRSGE